MSSDAKGRLVATRSSSPSAAHAPSVLDLRTAKLKRLVDVNPEVATSWKLGVSEVVRWKNREGQELEGLLMRTPHVKREAPGPLLVLPAWWA